MSAQKAYRALKLEQTSDGHQGLTITYYYDNLRSSRGNTVDATLNVDGLLDGFTDVDDYVDDVNIVFDSSFANYFPTSTMYWFNAVPAKRKVTFYGWENLNTSEVTSMVGMFESLGHYFDETISNQVPIVVENFSLSYFDTSKVSEMDNMFANVCLDELDISHFTFKPGVTTNMFLASSTIKDLYIPAAAVDWADEACMYMNGGDGPCTLHYPNSINPRATYLDNEVVNGNCESSNTTCLIGHDGDPGSVDATNFVNGAGYNGSRAVKVHASANATNDWEAMFFVYTPNHTWQAGDHYRFKMKVRADKASYIYSQSHWAPHEYIHYSMLGGSNYDVGTEWREIEYEGTISTQQVGAEGLKTIAFVLNGKKENINFYFDDISWEPIEMGSPTSFGWKGGIFKDVPGKNSYAVLSNNLRTLTLYDDDNKLTHEGEGLIFNTKMDSGYPEWYAYSGAVTDVVIDGSVSATTANSLHHRLFMNVGTADNPCLLTCPDGIITSPYFANGESKSDEIEIQCLENTLMFGANDVTAIEIDGNKCYKVNSAAVNQNDDGYVNWYSQFFVTTPNHDWKAGDRYRFKMKVRADKPAEIQVQSHIMPGDYLHWYMLDGTYNVSTEWQEIVYDGAITAEQAGREAMHTIAFQLNVLKEENNYYFDDITWEPFYTNSNYDDYFIWKGGYFLAPPKPEAYAVLSRDNKTVTFYYGDDKKSHASEGMIYRLDDTPGWKAYSDMITEVVLDHTFIEAESGFNSLPYDYFSGVGSSTPSRLTCPDDIITTSYYAYGESKSDGIEIQSCENAIVETNGINVNNARVVEIYGNKCYKVNSAKANENVDWYSEFFVTTPNHDWRAGDRYRFKMRVRADKPARISVQAHHMPGYYHYYAMLDGYYDVTTEWQEIEYEGTINNEQAGANYDRDTMHTIAFMLNLLKEENNYYFDNISWEPIFTNSNEEDYFIWKGGHFLIPSKPETYAVLSTDKTTLTVYYGEDKKSHANEGTIYRVYSGDSQGWSEYSSLITKVDLDPSFTNTPSNTTQLPYNYFSGLGTGTPCLLYYPSDYTLDGTSQETGYFIWKYGHFKTPTAYAVLSSDKKTLTFYCDDKKGTHTGSTGEYFLNTLSTGPAINSLEPNWLKEQDAKTSIKTVVFDESFSHHHPITTGSWFSELSNLTSIIHLDYLKTDKVVDFALMFYGCSSLTYADVSHFDTHNAKNFTSMFNDCKNLQNIDISHFDDSSVPYGYGMNSMFANCESLESIDISNFTFNSGTVTTYMLGNCTGLKTLTVSPSANPILDLYTSTSTAFKNVGSAASPCELILTENFILEDATYGEDYILWKGGYFKIHCDAYAQIDGDIMAFYYDNQYGKRSGTAYILDLDEAYDLPNWHHAPGTEAITKVIFDSSFKKAKPKNCRGWFYDFTNLTTIKDIENLNTSKVVNMNTMFLFCGNLTALDLSGFDTSNVTDMSYMFDGCYSMTTLSGINFDTSNVTDMSYMFSICSALTSLDVSHFDTSNVTDMSSMFAYCYELRNLDLSNFYFDENANTEDMLYFCQQLKALTIPESAKHWNDGACNGVGSQNQPCALFYPDGFTPEKSSTGDGWYRWKNGYFADILLGDANGDGTVSVADVMLTVNKAMNKPLTLFNEKSADINNDGRITVADVMGIVKLVLNSGRNSAPRNAYQSMSDAMAVTAKGNELTLHLTGTGSYTASQMTLTLPKGCRLESAQMVSSRSNGHSVQTSDLGNGQYRVVVYGASGMPFGNSCSDLVRLNVKGNHNGDVAVSDIQVVDYLTNTFLLSDVSGIATGIENLSTDSSDDGDWYTTQGQRVSTPTRGIYIRNGRKVVVR